MMSGAPTPDPVTRHPGDTGAATPATPRGRMDALDVARGLALLAMAVYHLSWDLRWFGLVDWPVDSSRGWRIFAGLIAGSFLVLVGVGLVLAHGRGIRWRKALVRAGRIALAAAAISLGTWLALDGQYVRFGILHEIALGSLLALPAVFLPSLITLALAAFVVALPHLVTLSFAGDSWFTWTGLVGYAPPSVDHVPLAPWFGAILAGVALARLVIGSHPWKRFAAWRAGGRGSRAFAFAGRHSLAVYLLHQPILFGTVWAIVELGLVADPAHEAFLDQCRMACVAATPGQEAACASACECTLDALLAKDKQEADMNVTFGQCRREAGLPGS
uniref:DUF1624 domain-containing protein n=1 Tax=Stappia sp. TaxID=1870903 RepID=UPI003BAD6268